MKIILSSILLFLLVVMIRPLCGQSSAASVLNKVENDPSVITGFVQENITIPVQNFDDAVIKIDNKAVLIDGFWEFKDTAGEVLEKPKIMSQPAELKDKLVLALRAPGLATLTITEGGTSKVYRINVRTRFKENDIEKELEEAIIKYTGDPGLRVAVLPPQAALVGANLRRAFGDETATEIVAPRGDVATSTTGEVTSREDYRPTILLEGELENDLKAVKALNIAHAYTDTVINLMSVRNHSQVQIKVNVISASENKTSDIGVQYGVRNAAGLFTPGFTLPININEAVGAGAPFFQVINANTISNIQAQINAAASKGVVKILAAPTLTVLNGQSAEFRSGQTVYIPTGSTTTDTATTDNFEEVQVGIGLRITPIVHEELTFRPFSDGTFPWATISAQDKRLSTPDASTTSRANNLSIMNTIEENGTIRLAIQPSLDSLGNQNVAAGPRAVNRNFVETRVAMKHGESLVIGGLFDDRTRKSLESVPFVEKIPIIGELFKNRTDERDRQEIIFVLTPFVVGVKDIKTATDRGTTSPMMAREMQTAGINTKPVRISAREVFVREPVIVTPSPEGTFQEVAPRSEEQPMGKPEAGAPVPPEAKAAPSTKPAPAKPEEGELPVVEPMPSTP
jgi:Flp pilus assembly secretin CpaC